MLGIVVQLAISWLVLWLAFRQHLEALGLRPNRARLADLGFGLILAGAACALTFVSGALLQTSDISVNPTYTTRDIRNSAGWHLRSVIYEELLFRGALLYVAIRKLGELKACLLSALAFGVYHWFTMGVLGNPVSMLIVFLFTGAYGLLFALAFARTGSLYLPVGLHFGWNLIQAATLNPAGAPAFLVQSGGVPVSPILFSLTLLIPFGAVPLTLYYYLRRRLPPHLSRLQPSRAATQ